MIFQCLARECPRRKEVFPIWCCLWRIGPFRGFGDFRSYHVLQNTARQTFRGRFRLNAGYGQSLWRMKAVADLQERVIQLHEVGYMLYCKVRKGAAYAGGFPHIRKNISACLEYGLYQSKRFSVRVTSKI